MTNLGNQPASTAAPGLLRIGAACAWALVLLVVAQMAVFATIPPPADLMGWFALFQASPVRGLLAYELLMVVYVVVSVPLVLALVRVLWPASPGLAATYGGLSLVAAGLFVVGRPGFELLALAQRHAVAASGEERAALLAAGQAIHAHFGGMAFQTSYVAGAVAGVCVAIAMARSRRFSPAAAWLRLASSVLDFGLFVPVVGLYLSLASVFCLLVWHVLVARDLRRLAQGPAVALA